MDSQKHDDTVGVSVHSGFPNPATDHTLVPLDFNALLIQHAASTFLFRIDGHEWQAQGILHGDIAVLDRALDPQPQDLVIWWCEDTFGISHVREIPEEATVWGVVTAIIHQYRKFARHAN